MTDYDPKVWFVRPSIRLSVCPSVCLSVGVYLFLSDLSLFYVYFDVRRYSAKIINTETGKTEHETEDDVEDLIEWADALDFDEY